MLLALLTQIGTYLIAGALCDADSEPVALRSLVLAGDNLADIAILKLLLDRDYAATNLTSSAYCSQRGVDIEGEVQNRSSLGEFADVARRGEDEDFALRRLRLEAVCNRVGGGIFEEFAEMLQPLLGTHTALLNTLITPMCCDTALGNLVHTLGTYLHLHPAATIGNYGGVQRLVTI